MTKKKRKKRTTKYPYYDHVETVGKLISQGLTWKAVSEIIGIPATPLRRYFIKYFEEVKKVKFKRKKGK